MSLSWQSSNDKSSCLLAGPALSGKLELLTSAETKIIDLSDEKTELELRGSPKLIWKKFESLEPGTRVVINRIDRVPRLMDYVRAGEQRLGLSFSLTAENLRRVKIAPGIKMTPLHPLTVEELGERFDLWRALSLGTLAPVYCSDTEDGARKLLERYPINYIRAEIERSVRNVGAFQRFLLAAARGNSQIIEYASIGRESSVPDNTVKEYYSVLEDTFMGNYLWPYQAGKKSRPKFFFFDCGVLRAIRGELDEKPNPEIFKTFFIRELMRIRDYWEKDHLFSFWKERENEVDLLIDNGREIALAIQIKADLNALPLSPSRAFRRRFPDVPIVVASLFDVEERFEGVSVKPWREVVADYEQIA